MDDTIKIATTAKTWHIDLGGRVSLLVPKGAEVRRQESGFIDIGTRGLSIDPKGVYLTVGPMMAELEPGEAEALCAVIDGSWPLTIPAGKSVTLAEIAAAHATEAVPHVA